MIRYLDKVIRSLVLILPKMNGYVKIKDGDENKNNNLMSFWKDNETVLEKYKSIYTKTEDLKRFI